MVMQWFMKWKKTNAIFMPESKKPPIAGISLAIP
jgi:hypothetical protein